MSALAEALLAAQRQAVGALGKAYVNGALDQETLFGLLDGIGLRDGVEQGLLLASLEVVKELGAAAPSTNGKPDPATEPASERQIAFLAKLADEKGVTAPDGPLTKAKASEAISALQAGTYNPDDYTAPF